jgi:isoaspartyl peptidase/L-asparaginase-like protein (Ntn-hydrolase superfamily)
MGTVVLANGDGSASVRKTVDTLMNKGSALDTVEAGIRVVEFR